MIEHMFDYMGMNRRYGSDVTDAAVLEVVPRPQPISLSPAEIGAEHVPDASEAVDVDAWVRFPEHAVRVPARAIAWTDRAVRVEFELRDGIRRTAWVWASAVSRRTPGQRQD